jgi:hypothetical protein
MFVYLFQLAVKVGTTNGNHTVALGEVAAQGAVVLAVVLIEHNSRCWP